jgi:hypothetical protein
MLPWPSTTISLQPRVKTLLISVCTIERTVQLTTQERLAGEEQAAVREPLRRPAEPGTARRRNLAVPVEIEGQDLRGAPVREPEPAVAGGVTPPVSGSVA